MRLPLGKTNSLKKKQKYNAVESTNQNQNQRNATKEICLFEKAGTFR